MLKSKQSLLAASLLTVLGTLQAGSLSAQVVVNEVLGSTAGPDSEFIELYNTGSAAVDIGGWQIILYESGDRNASNFGSTDGASPYVIPTATFINAGGYYLFANDLAKGSYGLTDPEVDFGLPANAIENSSYTLVLEDDSGNLVEAIFVTDGSRDGSDDAANDAGLVISPTIPTVGPDDSFLPAGFLRDAETTDGNLAQFQDFNDFQLTGTPQGSGEAPTLDPIGFTSIMEIQGEAHTSPLLGEEVRTEGVVTAVDSSSFYIQDPNGDDNIATCDAIVVFGGGRPLVGDLVEVRGTVSEFTPGGVATRNLSTTQISDVSVLNTLATDMPLPSPVLLGEGGRIPPRRNIDNDAFTRFQPQRDGIDFFESLEAMRVTVPDALAISNSNRFGEIFTVGDAGEFASGISRRGTLNISPRDFNPEKIQIDEDSGIFNFDFPQVDVGASLGDVTGVVGYGFGNFEVYPTEFNSENVMASSLAPEVTRIKPRRKRLTVATYNVLNLDPNDSDGDSDVANGRFDTIAAQIVNNLGSPDIIGLQEIQDNSGSDDDGETSADMTLQMLVDAIVGAGGPQYAFRDTPNLANNAVGGQPGGNIRVAFLFNPERVSIVGDVEPLFDFGDPTPRDNPFAGSRIPLAGVFEFNGAEVTVVNNHLSSKGGSAPILGIEQPFDERQEDVTVNGSLDERQRQAAAVAAYVDAILDEDDDANVVVLGDFNEFEFVSPVQDILGARLTNTTNKIRKKERYTFIFQGNSQSLDHILLSDALDDRFRVDIVHVNVEFAETSQRASDHDPILVSLRVENEQDKRRKDRDDEDDDDDEDDEGDEEDDEDDDEDE